MARSPMDGMFAVPLSDAEFAALDRLLAAMPWDDPAALLNRGNLLASHGHLEKALAEYDRALSLRPGFADGRYNRAMVLLMLGRFGEALADFDRALSVRQEFTLCRYNKALLLLLLGRFEEGWPGFEARRHLQGLWGISRKFHSPEWRGEDLSGKRLFLHDEGQGYGDIIQFAWFATMLAERGASVTLEVPRRLVSLMKSALPGVSILGNNREYDATPPDWEDDQFCDYQLPLMSVPHQLKFNPLRIPAPVRYLFVDPLHIAAWHLPDTGEFRVGIAWQSGPGLDADRSIPLREFAPLAAVPAVKLLSLQKFLGTEQLASLPPGMHIDTDDIDATSDFAETAALMMNLDLIVTADVVTANLAGALGCAVWVLLKDVPDWRWLLDREDTPWYPTARLFRQRRRGDWGEVMQRVAQELTQTVEASKQ